MILAFLALFAISAYQVYWLVQIYSTLSSALRKDVQEAMRSSDFEEIVNRVERLKDESIGGKMDVTVAPDASHEKAVVRNRYTPREQDGDTVSRDFNGQVPDDNIAYEDFVNMLKSEQDVVQVGLHMQRGLHTGLDLLRPVDVRFYDKVLARKLDSLGLRSNHATLLLHSGNDGQAVLTDTLMAIGIDRIRMRADTFRLDINSKGDMFYELVLERDLTAVPFQMRSAIVFSLFTFLMLAGAFWYMIRLIRKMRQLDEMKTDFTNNMTHELKTPIAIAAAANDVLLDFGHKCSPEKVEKYLSICREQLGVLAGLVEQILSLGMEREDPVRLEVETVEVLPVVRMVVSNQLLKAQKKPIVDIDVPPGMTVRADRRHFAGIMGNLIDNAIKYSPGVPSIVISARERKDGRRTVMVKDSGVGIEKDCQRFVFDKFYRVPQGDLHNVKGYGLGLFYVKGMMEKMGGSVSLRSDPGSGSVFILVFNG